MKERKIELIDEVASFNWNSTERDYRKLKNELKIFRVENNIDFEIDEAIDILDMLFIGRHSNNYEEAREIVAYIVRRLGSERDWNRIDRAWAYMLLGRTETPEQCISLMERVLADDKLPPPFKAVGMMNAAFRLSQAKNREKFDHEILTKAFDKAIEYSLSYCEESEEPLFNFTFKNIILFRKSMFHGEIKDDAITESYIKTLRNGKEKALAALLTKQFDDFKAFRNKTLEKNIINVVAGKKLRECRKRRGLLLEDVTAATGVLQQYLSGYEKGVKNLIMADLKALCKFYNITSDEILNIEVDEVIEVENLKLIKTNSHTTEVSENGKRLLIETITKVSEILS